MPTGNPSTAAEHIMSFDDLKFVALDRFMERLDEASTVGQDVDELQIDFMERCDQVLLKTVEGFMDDVAHLGELEDDERREALASQLDLALEDAVSLPELIEESLHLIEAMEDVAEAWLSVILFDPEKLRELYGLVEALATDADEYHASMTLRSLIMEFVYCSPLLTGEDWLRFRLMLEHTTDEAVIWVLNRFLNGHLEYVQVLQDNCLERYPELAQKVRSQLLSEATKFAKRLS